MARYTTPSGKSITLGKKLGVGGEGAVYDVTGAPQLVAKIYHPHRLNTALAHKVKAMVADPPEDATRKPPLNHVSIAWPTDVVLNGRSFAGYLMPKIPKSDDLYDLLQPQQRQKQHGQLNHRHLYRTARNLALAMEAIHQKNYVIGDVNFKNALFNDDALITMVDCDSMQVTEANGTVHRCIVGMPEYTAPELQGKDFNKEIRTANHDAFGLAVLIFQLLMQGFHPFTGRAKPGTPDVEQAHVYCIQHQIFPYLDNQPYEPPKVAPSFHALPPMLQLMFTRAFTNINNRPSPKEWAQVISMVEKRLVQCSNDANHYYPSDGACVICEIDYNSGRRQRTTPAPKATISMQVPLNQGASSSTTANPAPVSTPSATTGPLRPAPISTPSTSATAPTTRPTTTPRQAPPQTNPSLSIPNAPMGGRLWWSWLLSGIVKVAIGVRRWFKYVVGGIIALFLVVGIINSYQAIVTSQTSPSNSAVAPAVEPTSTFIPTATPQSATATSIPASPTSVPISAAVCDQRDLINMSWPMLNAGIQSQIAQPQFGYTVASRFSTVIDVTKAIITPQVPPTSLNSAITACGTGFGGIIELNNTQAASYIGCTNQTCTTQNLAQIAPAYDVLIRRGDQQTINVSGRGSLFEQLLNRPTNTSAITIIQLLPNGLNEQTFANLVLPILQKPLASVRNNVVIWHNKVSSTQNVSIPANTKWYTPDGNVVTTSMAKPIPQISFTVDISDLTWQDGSAITVREYQAWFDSCASRNDQHLGCTYIEGIRTNGTKLVITYIPGLPEDLAEMIAPYAIRNGGNSTASLLSSTTSQWRLASAFTPTRNQLVANQYSVTIETYTDVQQFVARLRRNETQIAVVNHAFANQVLYDIAQQPLPSDVRIELVPTGNVYVVQKN